MFPAFFPSKIRVFSPFFRTSLVCPNLLLRGWCRHRFETLVLHLQFYRRRQPFFPSVSVFTKLERERDGMNMDGPSVRETRNHHLVLLSYVFTTLRETFSKRHFVLVIIFHFVPFFCSLCFVFYLLFLFLFACYFPVLSSSSFL